MSKSLKLKNNNYWDSKGIVHNKQTLYDIFNQSYKTATRNESVASSGECYYLQIGKIVFVCITDVWFISETKNADKIFTGLPKSSKTVLFMMSGTVNNGADVRRARISINGDIEVHYDTFSTTHQYYAHFIYLSQ